MPESPNSYSFSVYSRFTLTHFFHRPGKFLIPAAYKYKVLSWLHSHFGHCIWVHHQFEIPGLQDAPSLVQANENHWGLKQVCKEGGSWFTSPLLAVAPSSNLLYVNEHCHAVVLIFFDSYQGFSCESFGAQHYEAN